MDIRATRPRIITRIITPRPETNNSKVQAGGVKRNPFKRHDTCDVLKKSAEKANNKDLTRSVPSSEFGALRTRRRRKSRRRKYNAPTATNENGEPEAPRSSVCCCRLGSGASCALFLGDAHRESGVFSLFCALSPVESCSPPEARGAHPTCTPRIRQMQAKKWRNA